MTNRTKNGTLKLLNMELDKKGIALGTAAEDFRNRKKFILNFYAQWVVENPARHIFNKSLNSFIEVRYLSMNETSGHASLSYKSTLAVTYLTEILENAISKSKPLEPKKDNKKTKTFFKNPHNGIRKSRLWKDKTYGWRIAR